MNRGGITERVIRFAQRPCGLGTGCLGLTNIAASMLFGGITGTAVADAASIGSVLIPGMKKSGYPADFSAAVTAASSTVGPIIPPSVPMIIVGSLSGISVGKMFLAGAVPRHLDGPCHDGNRLYHLGAQGLPQAVLARGNRNREILSACLLGGWP